MRSSSPPMGNTALRKPGCSCSLMLLPRGSNVLSPVLSVSLVALRSFDTRAMSCACQSKTVMVSIDSTTAETSSDRFQSRRPYNL